MPTSAPLRANLIPVPLLRIVNGHIRVANPAAAALGFLERGPLDELAPELAAATATALANNHSVRIEELEIVLDGRTRIFSAAIEPFERADGDREAVIFLTDLTAAAELANELARSVIDAEVANRRLDDTIAVLSLLARLGANLMRASTAPETLALLSDTLQATRRFTMVHVAADETAVNEAPTTPNVRIAAIATILSDADQTVDVDNVRIVPVRGRDRVHAVIIAKPVISPADEPALDLNPFASLAAVTLDNILLYRDLIESLQDLSFRNRVSRELQKALSQQEIETRLAELLPSYLPISWFGLVTGAEERDYPDRIADAVRAALRGHLSVHDGPEGASICVPIRLTGPLTRTDQEYYGVFAACSSHRGVFCGRGKELFLTLADIAAVPLRNVRMYNDLRAHNVAVQYLNEELSRTIRDLKTANEMKSHFVSIVSHEFRTPLTSISCYVDTLANEFEALDAGTTRQFLGVIKDETERLTRLINQLLDLSRHLARDRPPVQEQVNTTELVQSVMAALTPVAEQKGLEIAADLPQESEMLPGDPDGLYQVVLNVAGNSIRYTRAGSVRISVEGQPDFVYIRVVDTGIGIPADALDAIFSEFYTVPQTRAQLAGAETDRLVGPRSAGSGTGLGLSIAKAIVEQHGGVIQVQSRVGEGSTFTVMLPRKGAGT